MAIFIFTIILLCIINNIYPKATISGFYPYMAVICKYCGNSDNPEEWHLDQITCQGSLITSSWILTSTACNNSTDLWEWGENYDAILGFSSNKDIILAVRRPVVNWIPFGAQYDISYLPNDNIALCRLDEPLDKQFPLITIPQITWKTEQSRETSEDVISKSNCSFVGWLENVKMTSFHLQVFNVVGFYEATYMVGLSTNLYAMQTDNDAITGGAMVCNNMQVGIYLYILQDIGIYTKVTSYLPWIYTVIKAERDSRKLRIANIVNKDDSRFVNRKDSDSEYEERSASGLNPY